MSYEEVWKEQKKWLETAINHLKQRQKETTGKEKERVTAKLDGLNVVYQHMVESEDMYNLE